MEMQHKKRNFKMRPGMVVSGARGLSPGLPGLAIGLRVDEFLVSIAPQQKWPLWVEIGRQGQSAFGHYQPPTLGLELPHRGMVTS
jgi:hypothetical protein